MGVAVVSDRYGLTPREREVLELLAEGRTNKQIAETLFISESTAGVHVSNILGKLGAANRVEGRRDRLSHGSDDPPSRLTVGRETDLRSGRSPGGVRYTVAAPAALDLEQPGGTLGGPMQAVVHDRYGPPEVLHLDEVPLPEPRDDEIRVRIHASTVTRTDCGVRQADPFIWRFFGGFFRPRQRVLGIELSGDIDAIGKDVIAYQVGDRVFGVTESGAHAEAICLRETAAVAHIPTALGIHEAAAIGDGASLALACLRKAGVGPGTRVVVYGASGAVGTAGVQLAKHLGAVVTAVTDTRHLELVRSLGADHVIDYTAQDFATLGDRYDAVFDAVGKRSFRQSRRALRSGGSYVTTDLGFLWHVPLLVLATRFAGRKRALLGITRYSKADIELLRDLVEAGGFRPVIDRRYQLADIVEATRYVETGQKTGNVLLTVIDETGT